MTKDKRIFVMQNPKQTRYFQLYSRNLKNWDRKSAYFQKTLVLSIMCAVKTPAGDDDDSAYCD